MLKKPMFVCQKSGCEKRMQVQALAFLSVEADGALVLENVDFTGDSLEGHPLWYCEDDHEASEEHAEALNAALRHADAFGRPPGAGNLDIVVVTAERVTCALCGGYLSPSEARQPACENWEDGGCIT